MKNITNTIKWLSLGFMLLLFSVACKEKNAEQINFPKKDIIDAIKSSQLETNQDTLLVAYSYWWPQAGPFIGNCAQPYSLAFIGTIRNIEQPLPKGEGQSYISQWGTISIDEVLAKRTLENEHFHEEAYTAFDCFNGTAFKQDDRVLVFIYEYEGGYVIPGSEAIIKISGENDPKVKSIRTYITSNYDPLTIETDLNLWKEIDQADALKQLIDCKRTMQ